MAGDFGRLLATSPLHRHHDKIYANATIISIQIVKNNFIVN